MAILDPIAHPILEPDQLKSWTVQDYHRMSELGILTADEPTELIRGQIVLMAAKGTPHVLTLRLLAKLLDTQLTQSSGFVSTQDPIQLNNFSEPEPDLAIVRGTALDYADRHPRPEDLYLVVEIADTTLKQDCNIKDKLYAHANIPDFWVVDLKNRQLHIFRDPTPTGYTSHLILAEPNQVTPLAFPEVSIVLTAILPPAS